MASNTSSDVYTLDAYVMPQRSTHRGAFMLQSPEEGSRRPESLGEAPGECQPGQNRLRSPYPPSPPKPPSVAV